MKKEYYIEELEKPINDKTRALKNQKFFTAGSIVMMFIVLIIMYFILA